MKLINNQIIYFLEDKLPYKIMAASESYAIAVRKLHRREDADLLHHQVKMSAYYSFTQAFNSNKFNPVYSIIDFNNNKRGSDNLVFGMINYFSSEDCEKCINMLESGEIQLSHRNSVELNIKP